MRHLGVGLAFRPKFEDNALRSKDLSNIQALRPGPRLQPPISNRDTKLLETELNDRKQKTDTHSNRDKTRLFLTTFLPPHPPASQTQPPQNSWRRAKNEAGPNQFLFRLEMHATLCFVRVREILDEPLFRLDMRSTASKNRKHTQHRAWLESQPTPRKEVQPPNRSKKPNAPHATTAPPSRTLSPDRPD